MASRVSRQGADLVDLDQDRVAGALGDALRQALRVGDEEIVAHDLHVLAQALGHRHVAVPVVLVEGVLDRDDRVLRGPAGEQLDHVGGREQLARIGLPELVAFLFALVEEFGRGAVHGDGEVLVAAGLVAGFDDGVHDVLERVLVVDVGREAALVADVGVVPGLLEHALERVEDLAHLADGFRPALGAHRHDHEFLEIDLVVRVLAAVDDVRHRHRQLAGVGAADVAVQRQVVAIAAALATARDTPRMAFAPSLDLFSVPSSSISRLSIRRWSMAGRPSSSPAILSLTLATAVSTPLPRYLLLSPSRSSNAS